ncbi:MAG: hypothetical protein ABEI06_05025 [Halobacteriaceae archaeon]
MSTLDLLRHDSLHSMISVGIGYGLLMVVLFVLLFLIPYGVFLIL